MDIRKMPRGEIGVFLSDDDLEEYGIDVETGKPRAKELHKLLFDVMENVRTQTDFDPYNGGQVVVEAMMVPGGMNLLISKIGTNFALPILPASLTAERLNRKTPADIHRGRRTVKGGKRLTRRQFASVKNIRVINTNNQMSGAEISNRTFIDFLKEIGLIRPIELKKNVNKKKELEESVFVFDSFENTESALCNSEEGTLKESSLYRNGSCYALVTKLKKDSIQYNILSEFSYRQRSDSVTAAYFRESWKPVVCGEELVKMAEAVKAMQG